MADNILVTPGAGATVATDEVGSRHFQIVKLAHGADGTAGDVTTANPLPVAPNNGASGVTAVASTFTGTGQSASFAPTAGRGFNFTLSGTFVGTVRLDRSFDNGSTWHPVTAMGAAVSFTAPCTEVLEEPESAMRYRVNCVAYTSGTITYRLSQ